MSPQNGDREGEGQNHGSAQAQNSISTIAGDGSEKFQIRCLSSVGRFWKGWNVVVGVEDAMISEFPKSGGNEVGDFCSFSVMFSIFSSNLVGCFKAVIERVEWSRA